MSVDFVRHDPICDMVGRAPEGGLCWAEVPRFEETVLAREVLRPVGYQEGMPLAVGPVEARDAALLHVSFECPAIPAGVRPTVADYARRCSDVVDDQLALQDWRLSPREFEVLRLLARGLSNQEMADRLYVTRRTVAAHVEHLLAKNGASSRVVVATWAARLGLIRL